MRLGNFGLGTPETWAELGDGVGFADAAGDGDGVNDGDGFAEADGWVDAADGDTRAEADTAAEGATDAFGDDETAADGDDTCCFVAEAAPAPEFAAPQAADKLKAIQIKATTASFFSSTTLSVSLEVITVAVWYHAFCALSKNLTA